MNRRPSYDAKEAAVTFFRAIEVPCIEVPDKDLLRVRYPTETQIANTGIRFGEDSFSHSTLVAKLETDQLAPYTLEASQNPCRGVTIVTTPNGYVGVEGTLPYPQTRVGFEGSLVDTLSVNSNYIDNVHPRIMRSIKERNR